MANKKKVCAFTIDIELTKEFDDLTNKAAVNKSALVELLIKQWIDVNKNWINKKQ